MLSGNTLTQQISQSRVRKPPACHCWLAVVTKWLHYETFSNSLQNWLESRICFPKEKNPSIHFFNGLPVRWAHPEKHVGGVARHTIEEQHSYCRGGLQEFPGRATKDPFLFSQAPSCSTPELRTPQPPAAWKTQRSCCYQLSCYKKSQAQESHPRTIFDARGSDRLWAVQATV